MPLRAIVDKKTLTGPDLSIDEWKDLQVRHKRGLPVLMPCCGSPGHLRTSKAGTQHFYHAADAGCRYAEESPEHLAIKEQIYRACRSENWETTVEFPAPDRRWIADVYAVRDDRRVVFEIQISPIPLAELEERDRRYRADGIESYWLLEKFLGRSKDFASGYRSHLFEETGLSGEKIPYIDDAIFLTGTENHIFIPKGIRSIGLSARKQTLFSTNNPEIPLAVWVREVLKGNYQRYLEETAAAYRGKRRLMILAAPDLLRFRDFYGKIIRHGTYRKRAEHCQRRMKTDPLLKNDRAVQKKFMEISAEIDWLEKEYRFCVSESSGLFMWKKNPGSNMPGLFFRLEPESNVKKLQERVGMFVRWEETFERAMREMEFRGT